MGARVQRALMCRRTQSKGFGRSGWHPGAICHSTGYEATSKCAGLNEFFCTKLREKNSKPFKRSRTHVIAVRVITLEREYHIITSDMFMTWQHNKFSIIILHNILFVTPSSYIIKFEPIQTRLSLIQNQHKCK